MQKILLIRRDNIGDLVCTTPAFVALRKHYPNAQIGALVNSYNAEVLRGNPNVDRVFVYQKLKHAGGLVNQTKALVQRLKLIVQLRRWQPDATILAKSSYDRHGLNFARQIGAKNIIGFVPDDLSQAKGLPDIQLKTPEFNLVHEVEAINQLLAPLGINDALGPLQVFPDTNAVVKIGRKPLELKRYIALHISAREQERRWGIDNFIALTNHLIKTQPNIQILLLWSPGKESDRQHPGDDVAAEKLIKAVDASYVVPMPTQNITELIVALSHCNLFIGADGGAMHLAAALKKPILALFENLPGKLNHWYPWRVRYRMASSQDPASPAVSQIKLGQVMQHLEELDRLDAPDKTAIAVFRDERAAPCYNESSSM